MAEQGQIERLMTTWFNAPYESYRRFVRQVNELLWLSTQGIRQTEVVLKSMEMLATSDDSDFNREVLEDDWLETQRQLVTLSREEQKNDYPLLHAHALVSFWGALEAGMHDLVVAILMNDPDAMRRENVSKIRMSVAEFAALDEYERANFLASELRRSLSSDLKFGVGQFESVLGVFGLSGPVTEAVSRGILELQQLRHVIVHRIGIADRSFLRRCPWIDVDLGESVKITHKQYVKLAKYSGRYFKLVNDRMSRRYMPAAPGVS